MLFKTIVVVAIILTDRCFMESFTNPGVQGLVHRFMTLCQNEFGKKCEHGATEESAACYTNNRHQTEADTFEKFDKTHEIEMKEASHQLEEFWLDRCEIVSGSEHDSRLLSDADRQIVKSPSRTSWHGFNGSGEQRELKAGLVFAKRTKKNKPGPGTFM